MKFTLAHNALVPFDDAAIKWLGDGTHQIGEVVQAALLDERENAYRAYVFMTINKIAKAAGVTIDEMRAQLQVVTGRYKEVRLPDGRLALTVKSMNLLSMSDDEMRSFWKDAQPHIEALLPRFIDIDADEIRQLLEGPQR
jgi:hypothetical protein